MIDTERLYRKVDDAIGIGSGAIFVIRYIRVLDLKVQVVVDVEFLGCLAFVSVRYPTVIPIRTIGCLPRGVEVVEDPVSAVIAIQWNCKIAPMV